MERRRRRSRRLRELPLLTRCVLLLAAVRLSLRVRRLDATRRWIDRHVKRAPTGPEPLGPPPARLARLVQHASHLVPWGRHCLSRSLTLEALLIRRGRSATTRFGVARGEDGGIDAHAWVVCEGEVLLGGDQLERFTAMTAPGRDLD